MEQPRKVIKAVAAIIRRCDEILVAQRGKGVMEGEWEFPGCIIQPGESPEEVLKRRMKEELDMEIIISSLFDKVEYDYPEAHLSLQLYYCAPMNDSTVHLHDHQSYCWLHYEQLDSVEWLPSDISVVKKLQNELRLSKWGGELVEDDFVSMHIGVNEFGL